MSRSKEVLHDDSFSECEACGDRWDAANHQALAARHTDKTGHRTTVTFDRSIAYSGPEELPGQVSIFDEIAEAA